MRRQEQGTPEDEEPRAIRNWQDLCANAQGRWRRSQSLLVIVAKELIRTNVFDVAAGLAFWSMLSMVPLLIMAVSVLAMLRLPGLLPQLLSVMAMLVPADALSLVEKLMGGLLRPHRGMLSFGILIYMWSTTTGFTALISALNVAYDIAHPRSWLRDRLQALLLAFTSGGLLTISLVALLAGPHFAHFVGQIVPIPPSLERTWPLIRLGTVFVTFVVALELVYFLAPNRKQRFASTLPGAVVAIALWFGGSAGLAFYLNHLAHYSRLYGGMGAVIALMFWVYLTGLAILIGAELNEERAKRHDTVFCEIATRAAASDEAEWAEGAAADDSKQKRPAA